MRINHEEKKETVELKGNFTLKHLHVEISDVLVIRLCYRADITGGLIVGEIQWTQLSKSFFSRSSFSSEVQHHINEKSIGDIGLKVPECSAAVRLVCDRRDDKCKEEIEEN